MKYIYHTKKLKRTVHILDKSGTGTICKVTPITFSRMEGMSDKMPEGRRICGICEHLSHKGKEAKRKKYPQKIGKSSDKFYASYQWRELRYKALKMYGPRCMLCGATSEETRICGDMLYNDLFFVISQRCFSLFGH